jgi:NYN domain
MRNIRLFVDFWNLQLRWNDHMRSATGSQTPVPLAWRKLPSVLKSGLSSILGSSDEIILKGTRIFASVNPRKGSSDERLKVYLHSLGQAPGIQVTMRDRRPIKDTCPSCHRPIERTVQKGVGAEIITALFEGAISNSYDMALLISSDADYVSAIHFIQNRLNKEIVHVGFKDGGAEVRSASWGHVLLDGDIAAELVET